MSIQLVVTDLDGTLWDSRQNVAPETIAALDELRRRNIEVLAATARGPKSTFATFNRIGIDLPAVLCNGAMGRFSNGTSFHQRAFPKTSVMEILAVFEEAGMVPSIPIDHPQYGAIIPVDTSSCATFKRDTQSFGLEVHANDALHYDVVAFRLIGLEREQLQDLAAALSAREDVEVYFSEDALYGGWSLQIGPVDVSKWLGVSAYCEHAGLDLDAVLGIGDDTNDVDYLSRSRIGLAMPHAASAVVDAADYVLTPEQGWSTVLDYV